GDGTKIPVTVSAVGDRAVLPEAPCSPPRLRAADGTVCAIGQVSRLRWTTRRCRMSLPPKHRETAHVQVRLRGRWSKNRCSISPTRYLCRSGAWPEAGEGKCRLRVSGTRNSPPHEPILVITTRRLMPLFGLLGSARSDAPTPLDSSRAGSMWNWLTR